MVYATRRNGVVCLPGIAVIIVFVYVFPTLPNYDTYYVMRGVLRQQETSEQLLAAIVDLSPRERPAGNGAINGGVNFAEQTSQDILEVQCYVGFSASPANLN